MFVRKGERVAGSESKRKGRAFPRVAELGPPGTESEPETSSNRLHRA